MRFHQRDTLTCHSSQEINSDTIELIKPNHTLVQSLIQDGDIACFQVDISDREGRDLESQGLCSNPQQFYKLLQNRVMKRQPVDDH